MGARVEALAARAGLAFVWDEVTALPDALAYLGPMAHDVVVSSDAIRRELGYAEVRSVEEALDDHLAGLRASRG